MSAPTCTRCGSTEGLTYIDLGEWVCDPCLTATPEEFIDGAAWHEEFLRWEEIEKGVSSRLMDDPHNKPSRTSGSARCWVCTRELRSRSSIANGIGPVCAARKGGGF